tara:strand:+ start:438 stop:1169 length:732 start_codon:yes stop_codon:yes gene_type:complete
MALNQFDVDNYLETAVTRVTQQFRGKPVFERYLKLLLSGFDEIQDAVRQLQVERSIDTAIGTQLDVIGDIVGRSRETVTAELFEYFGFFGHPQADTFGSLNDFSVGSTWYSLGGSIGRARQPSDEEYRLILKAKILKNRTLSRPEDVIEAYRFLFGTSAVYLEEYGPAAVRIGIGKILSSVERGLLFDLTGVGPLLPKTIGVNYSYSEYNASRLFATEGYPMAIGVGDLNIPDSGGMLSNLIS